MKNLYLIITLTLIMAFLLVPLMAVNNTNEATSSLSSTESKPITEAKAESFLVLLTGQDKPVELQTEEYLIGVLAAEMSADYNEEALKAQAVAAYTYALRKKGLNKNEAYDITNDSEIDQSYITKAQREKKWGSKAAENEKKLKKAVESVKGEIITYNGEPILAAYHSVSSGNTESALNVWGTDYPYLKSVASGADLLAPDFLSEKTFEGDELAKILKTLDCTTPEKDENIVGKSAKSDGGTVLKFILCGKELKGSEVRKAFSLRSAAFDAVYKDGKLTFTVSGYGHLVGMSQFGANYLAEQGSGYKEILTTYYTGVLIEKRS